MTQHCEKIEIDVEKFCGLNATIEDGPLPWRLRIFEVFVERASNAAFAIATLFVVAIVAATVETPWAQTVNVFMVLAYSSYVLRSGVIENCDDKTTQNSTEPRYKRRGSPESGKNERGS